MKEVEQGGETIIRPSHKRKHTNKIMREQNEINAEYGKLSISALIVNHINSINIRFTYFL